MVKASIQMLEHWRESLAMRLPFAPIVEKYVAVTTEDRFAVAHNLVLSRGKLLQKDREGSGQKHVFIGNEGDIFAAGDRKAPLPIRRHVQCAVGGKDSHVARPSEFFRLDCGLVGILKNDYLDIFGGFLK
jgi:hypothetical protein